MKVFSSDYTFDYSWEEVSINNWRKYNSWNGKAKHVIAVDTLARSVDPETNILRTERLITCEQNAPAWVVSLLGGSMTSHVHEISYVDPASKRVTMVSTNLSWSNILSVRETVIYEPDNTLSSSSSSSPSSSSHSSGSESTSTSTSKNTAAPGHERTRFRQEAKITALCGGWQKIKTKIEEATIERFGENAKKGREGFEEVLQMSRRAFGEERKEKMRGAPQRV